MQSETHGVRPDPSDHTEIIQNHPSLISCRGMTQDKLERRAAPNQVPFCCNFLSNQPSEHRQFYQQIYITGDTFRFFLKPILGSFEQT